MNVDDDLNTVLSTLKSPCKSQLDGFLCEECSLPLKDYGCEPLIFGENDSFIDHFLCYKCAADFFGEEDYHSEESKRSENTIIEPNKQDSRARIRGMQTTVYEVLKSLASGMTESDIFKKFPCLTHKDILACLDFAAEREKGFL